MAFFALIFQNLFGQEPFLELTFTGLEGTAHRQLDSVNVLNLDNEADTTLFWPDTVLALLYPVGLGEMGESGASLSMTAWPNPFSGRCHLRVELLDEGKISLTACDLPGRKEAEYSASLPRGVHGFEFTPVSGNIHIIRLVKDGRAVALKVISLSGGDGAPELIYTGDAGLTETVPDLKFETLGFSYAPGEVLLFSGYSQGMESVMYDSPDISKSYPLQFAVNTPCAEDSVVSYLGREYPTVQVFSQCWLKANLNAGTMINGMANMSDDGILEKYCVGNDSVNCSIYGALYQWDEMMQYTVTNGARGICPPGWHVPTDLEWRILEGAADSQYAARDGIWDTLGFRGFDAGDRLKSDSLWKNNLNGNNATGFNALPSGTRGNGGFFLLLRENAPFWSSSTSTGSHVWYRVMTYNSNRVYRYSFDRYSGFGVRCLRDD